MIIDELTKLAGLLSSRPIGPDSYKLDELLAGLDAERSRLGRRKFVVVFYQNEFDFDGLTDYVFLLDSFDDQSEAIACVASQAQNLQATQTAQPDSRGLQWVLESDGGTWYIPNPTGKHLLSVLHDQTYKLRAGPYDTKYNSFRAIGPFADFVVCEQLFEFVNSRFELWSYFVEIGEAVLAGNPMKLHTN